MSSSTSSISNLFPHANRGKLKIGQRSHWSDLKPHDKTGLRGELLLPPINLPSPTQAEKEIPHRVSFFLDILLKQNLTWGKLPFTIWCHLEEELGQGKKSKTLAFKQAKRHWDLKDTNENIRVILLD